MSIKLYWEGGDRNDINFGDTLSPKIVEIISGKPVSFAGIYDCDIVAIGSLLDKVIRRQWKRLARLRLGKTHVWGTGSFGTDAVSRHKFLRVAAVRGPMTRKLMQLPDDLPLGDPGLFVNRMVASSARKTHRWGIIPHVADRALPAVQDMQKQTPGSCIIDLGNPNIQETLDTINGCEFIISSSLHGLITADALGIPNVWMKISDNVNGGDWKFHDYFLSVGRPAASATSLPLGDLRGYEHDMTRADAAIVAQRQKDLETAFKNTGL